MEQSSQTIRMRSWRTDREITQTMFGFDIEWAEGRGYPVHRWSGEGRDGQPMEIVWVTTPHAGELLSAYEITGGE